MCGRGGAYWLCRQSLASWSSSLHRKGPARPFIFMQAAKPTLWSGQLVDGSLYVTNRMNTFSEPLHSFQAVPVAPHGERPWRLF